MNFKHSKIFHQIIISENGNLKHASGSLIQLLGIKQNSLNNQRFIDFLHDDQKQQVSQLMDIVFEGYGFQFDLACQMKTAPEMTPTWIHWEFSSQKNEHSKIEIIAIGFDISMQYKLREKINQNSIAKISEETKYKNLIELSPVGIILMNISGKMIEVNPAICKITGYTMQEIVKTNYWDLTPNEYKSNEIQQLQWLKEKGEFEPYEKEFIHKNGNRISVIVRSQIFYSSTGDLLFYSTIEDISIIKIAELQLATANRLLNDILENSAQISIMVTDHSGTITLFNKGAETMLGYTSEEVVGKYTPRFFHLQAEIDDYVKELNVNYDVREKYKEEFFETNQDKSKQVVREWTFVTKSGKYIRVINSVSPILNNKNEVTGFLGMAIDVTELRRNENIIREQNEKLKRVTFVQSHVLRHPVSNILAALSILNPDKLDPETLEIFQLMDKSSRKMDEIITQLIQNTSSDFE